MWRSVFRSVFSCFVFILPGSVADGLSAAPWKSPLISAAEAARHGLARPWFAQADLDRSRARLRHMVLYEGALYVQSDRGLVQAIDAETGAALWSKRVGRPDHPTLPLGVGRFFVAVVNGSRLYVLNRDNGELLYETEAHGAPDGGPAVSDERVYLPMVQGMIAAYRLKRKKVPGREFSEKQKRAEESIRQEEPVPEDSDGGASTAPAESAPAETDRPEGLHIQSAYIPPLLCRSKGRTLMHPLVLRQDENEESVAWPSDAGYLYVGRVDRKKEVYLEVRYRLETAAPITLSPVYVPPNPQIHPNSGILIAASQDGSVAALLERSGKLLWGRPLGEPIIRPPVVIGDRVYVTTQLGGLYRLDLQTGEVAWFAPGLTQFVAAAKTRIYAADRRGRLQVLNADTGARLDVLSTEALPLKLTNAETDRIYLATASGLIQCLRELEQEQPIRYDKARRQAAPEPKAPPKIEQKGFEAAEEPFPEEPGEAEQPVNLFE